MNNRAKSMILMLTISLAVSLPTNIYSKTKENSDNITRGELNAQLSGINTKIDLSEIYNSVVFINRVTWYESENSATNEPHYSGTGIFLKNGYILTNKYVIDKDKSFSVLDRHRDRFPAQVAYVDEKTDLALLKVNGYIHTGVSISRIKKERSAPGEKILVYGNPKNLKFLLTDGIVTPSDSVKDLIISAQLYSGNPGSPVFTKYGEILGIVYKNHPDMANRGIVTDGNEIVDFLSRAKYTEEPDNTGITS